MIMYSKWELEEITEEATNQAYLTLLEQKLPYLIISTPNGNHILTKERSLIPINDIHDYIESQKQNIYYKTIVKEKKENKLTKEDLELFKNYMKKYEPKMRKIYGNKYCFGCVAVRIKQDSFITTIRGKENLEEFTIVDSVDHKNHLVYVNGKKATLNAPLLSHLFQNKKVKIVIHLHEFDDYLPYYEYATPGTVKDSFRKNTQSFNIRYHGLFLLLDKNGNRL